MCKPHIFDILFRITWWKKKTLTPSLDSTGENPCGLSRLICMFCASNWTLNSRSGSYRRSAASEVHLGHVTRRDQAWPRRSVLPLQLLRDALDADVLPEVAEARAATGDFLYVGFGEPAPLPVRQPDALHPAWRTATTQLRPRQPSSRDVQSIIMSLTVAGDGLGVKDVGLLQRELVVLLGLVAFDALDLGYIWEGETNTSEHHESKVYARKSRAAPKLLYWPTFSLACSISSRGSDGNIAVIHRCFPLLVNKQRINCRPMTHARVPTNLQARARLTRCWTWAGSGVWAAGLRTTAGGRWSLRCPEVSG